jgi:hypothetical protein
MILRTPDWGIAGSRPSGILNSISRSVSSSSLSHQEFDARSSHRRHHPFRSSGRCSGPTAPITAGNACPLNDGAPVAGHHERREGRTRA